MKKPDVFQIAMLAEGALVVASIFLAAFAIWPWAFFALLLAIWIEVGM